MRRWAWSVLLLMAAAGPATQPLLHAHAHNDYRHARPLAEALERGFCSVEADIHVIRGEILVAHDRHEAETEVGSTARTLETLYLEPLRKKVEEGNGRVYPEVASIFLLIDMKSNPAAPAYEVLKGELKKYESILTVWGPGKERKVGAVTVIITGSHTHQMIGADEVRMCASDGMLPDLERGDLSADLCPLISSQWKKSFTWNGKGKMPDGERERLREIVKKAHDQGRLIRFWDAPDNQATWKELRAAGVDLVNTDDLAGLQKYLLAN